MIAFNGAATFQSRKLHRRQLYIPRRAAFNGAATFQSRKRRDRGADHDDHPAFNGAATFQSRKLANGMTTGPLSQLLQWSRDLSVAETSELPSVAWTSAPLQWSRDLSVAETGVWLGRLPGAGGPSMEPRPFSRGNSFTLHPHVYQFAPSMEPRPFSRGNK